MKEQAESPLTSVTKAQDARSPTPAKPRRTAQRLPTTRGSGVLQQLLNFIRDMTASKKRAQQIVGVVVAVGLVLAILAAVASSVYVVATRANPSAIPWIFGGAGVCGCALALRGGARTRPTRLHTAGRNKNMIRSAPNPAPTATESPTVGGITRSPAPVPTNASDVTMAEAKATTPAATQ